MRLSADGQHRLGATQGVYIDGRLVMPNANHWDFLSDRIIGCGGFDTPDVGRYEADLNGGNLRRVIDPSGANFYTTITKQLWTDGASRWLLDCTDGARDSDGHFWPDRAALGSSRQGDWVFVRKSDYAAAIVRRADGQEFVFDLKQFFYFGGIDAGCLLLLPVRGPLRAFELTRGAEITAPAMVATPDGIPFATDAAGKRWLAAYQPGWSLVFADWDAAPNGWLLSKNGPDFLPTIARRAEDGLLVIASGSNAGETVSHLYEVDQAAFRWRVDGGAWQPRIPIDTSKPGPLPGPPVVQALPPILIGSYYAYTDRFYANSPGDQDLPEPTGNCTFVLYTPDLPGRGSDAARRCLLPAIVDIELVNFVKKPIAISKAAGSVDAMRSNINANANVRPDLPRLEYLDMAFDDPNGWLSFNHRPSWLPASAWIGVQVYFPWDVDIAITGRNVGEALALIRAAFGAEQNIQLIVQAFDRNHRATLAQVEAIQPFWQTLARHIDAKGLQFFAWARPGGMLSYPTLFEWFKAYAAAVPPGLPDWADPDPQPQPEPGPDPVPPQPQPQPPHPVPVPKHSREGVLNMKVLNDHLYAEKDFLPNPHPSQVGKFCVKEMDAAGNLTGNYVSVRPNGSIGSHFEPLDQEAFVKQDLGGGLFLMLADRRLHNDDGSPKAGGAIWPYAYAVAL